MPEKSSPSLSKVVSIFTDGACSGNPGPGGWAAVLKFNGTEKEVTGFEAESTNNRMELKAAIEGLKALKKPTNVKLYTDSQYVRTGITTWVKNWQAKGWKTADKKPVKNKELWQELVELNALHQVEWHWVKAHSGHPENEQADALARKSILTQMMHAAGGG